MTQDVKMTKLDRMRYTKDTASANFVLLAIVMNVLYFVSIYQCDHATHKPEPTYLYYSWSIGASVIYNLLFLLITFLASEGVKGRKTGYTIPLLVVGAMQFVRVFYLPAKAHASTYMIGDQVYQVMTDGQYIFALIMLIGSGVLCILAAINSYMNNTKLANYLKSIEN